MEKILNEITEIIPRKIHYCDVGARFGLQDPWESFRKIIDLTCFEPDIVEYNLLVKDKINNDKIFPYALTNESKEITLNLTKTRGCSSLYKPNLKFLKNYPEVERFGVEKTVNLEATSLDVLFAKKIIPNIDFIKIDTQGSELNIIKGGENLLSKNILGLEVEVEFQAVYEKQPLFSEIDNYVRNIIGLEIQDLRKTYWKYPVGINIGSQKGQLISGDALYFRSPNNILSMCSNFEKNEAASRIQSACIMGIVYGYFDFSLCLLNQPSINDFLDIEITKKWKNLIVDNGKSIRYTGTGSRRLSRILNYLYRIFYPTTNGWASIGHHLGTRKKFGIFY